jgi:hypothetical protein
MAAPARCRLEADQFCLQGRGKKLQIWRKSTGPVRVNRKAARHNAAAAAAAKTRIMILRRPKRQQSAPPSVLARGIAQNPTGPSNSAAKKQQNMSQNATAAPRAV